MSKCIYDTTRECPTITNENGYTYPKYKDCVDCFKTRCIEIPEKATNGDMWLATFGGKVESYDESCGGYIVKEIDSSTGRATKERFFSKDWWDAPYVIPNSKN